MTEPRDGAADQERRARRDRWRTPSRRRVNGAPADAPARQTGRSRILNNPTWQDLLSLILSAAPLLVVLVVLPLLIPSMLSRAIVIEPISMPKTLADEGYGPYVGARRLQDALVRVGSLGGPANLGRLQQTPSLPLIFQYPDFPNAVLQKSDLSNITVPGLGVPLASFLSGLGSRITISGEFTIIEHKLGLVVRANHLVIFANQTGGDPHQPDTLLEQAAIALFGVTDPATAAAIHNNLGNAKDREGKANEAISEYWTAIALDPRSVPPRFNLANVLADQGNADEAVDEFRTAIVLDPNFAPPHVGLGLVLSDQGKPDQAIAEYRAAITLDPTAANPHVDIGNVLSGEGMPDQAIAEYRAAINIDPKSANPHVGVGNVLSGEGKPDQAIAEYRAAINLDPTAANPHVGLGNALRDQGKPEQAIAEYQTAILLNPRDPGPHVSLAAALAGQGKTDDAIVEYRVAIRLAPKDALSRYNLGLILRKRVTTQTPASDRHAMLSEACELFMTAENLAPRKLDYAAAMRSVDVLLANGQHCPSQ